MIHSQDRCAWLRHLRTSRTTLFSLRSTLIFGRSFPRRHRTCRVLLVERLREFLRLNYVTGAEVARRIGVTDGTVYSWLQGEFRPANTKLISAFLDSMPIESSLGISPTGYEYREYKNWRGIPEPRRCLFCKQVKGEIRQVRGGCQGFRPNCGATGPKRESYDEPLKAWNGRKSRS
jgi:transcriptional regulator with XRE-family HTH domain